MSGDRAVFLTCLLAGAWLIGVEMGEATPKTIHTVASCPAIEQGEKLQTITIDRGVTRCTYQPAPYGRASRKQA
jgi:hypothetical protein